MRTPLTIAAVAATGLLLVGGGTAVALGAGEPETVSVVPTTAAADAQPVPEPPAVDRAGAERIALELVGAGRVTDAEFDEADRDDDDDRYDRDHWEIEIHDGPVEHDVDVDAATGEILDHDIDRDDD
ncbi:PepSY domain-containing protein [Pseudonocardia nematodicida]|uniref:PepSY domain-containing protein n=1 Tax=Pseudonocardia nematodicida TaxID=1206997 RepID=A0ABV1K786_9PSEU